MPFAVGFLKQYKQVKSSYPDARYNIDVIVDNIT